MYSKNMYSKKELLKQLEDMDLDRSGSLMVHSSMTSIGEVEGGADTVLEALIDYMEEGLLTLPSHTWEGINIDNPRFYVEDTPSSIGVLPELFRKRPGVIRSLHPTHSLAAIGKEKEDFVRNHETFTTPCSRKSPYGKLLDRGGTILLIGVDLRRNTFIHGVEEWAKIPGRLTSNTTNLYTVLGDGREIEVPSYRHHGLRWSEHYWKVDDFLQAHGAIRLGKFGDALVRICDTVKMTDLLMQMLEINPDLFSDNEPIDLALYKKVYL